MGVLVILFNDFCAILLGHILTEVGFFNPKPKRRYRYVRGASK